MFGKPDNKLYDKKIQSYIEDPHYKKILIFGTGMLIEPLIDYLLQDDRNIILLTSNEPIKLIELYDKKNKAFPYTPKQTNVFSNDIANNSSEIETHNRKRLYIFELELILESKTFYTNINDNDYLNNSFFYFKELRESFGIDNFNDEEDMGNDSQLKRTLIQQNKKIASEELLNFLIKNSALAIPFIPSIFHLKIAKICIKYRVNMITSNMINEEIKSLEQEIINNDMLIIPELGLQPGLDHLLCTKVINEMKKEQKEVVSVEIWCGLVPSPECMNNPIMHKFAFSPKQNIDVLNSDTRQLINGKIVRINKMNNYEVSSSLLHDRKFHPSLNLEGIFTEDALEFKEKHNLDHCDTVIIGVVRYKWYSLIIHVYKLLGLLNSDRIISEDKYKNWKMFFNSEVLLKKNTTNDNESTFSFLNSRLESFVDTDMNLEQNKEVKIFNKKLKKYFNKTVKGNYFKIGLLKLELGELKFYIDITLAAMIKLNKKNMKSKEIMEIFKKLFDMFIFLNLFEEKIDFGVGNYNQDENTISTDTDLNSNIINSNDNGNNGIQQMNKLNKQIIKDNSKYEYNIKFYDDSVMKDKENKEKKLNELINKEQNKKEMNMNNSNTNTNINTKETVNKDNIKELVNKGSLFDCFLRLLEKKIKMNSNDVDLVFLQTIFTIKNKQGQLSIKKYEIMKNGTTYDKNICKQILNNPRNMIFKEGYSATSVMVGLPTAVIAQLVLNNEIKDRGIVIPKESSIINKIFDELERKNIYVTVRDEILAKF